MFRFQLAFSIPLPGETDTTTTTTTSTIQREVKSAAIVSPLVVAVDIESETSQDVFTTPPDSPNSSSSQLSQYDSIKLVLKLIWLNN